MEEERRRVFSCTLLPFSKLTTNGSVTLAGDGGGGRRQGRRWGPFRPGAGRLCSFGGGPWWNHCLAEFLSCPARLLCPWGFSGKSIEGAAFSLLQGIFPVCVLHRKRILYPLSGRGTWTPNKGFGLCFSCLGCSAGDDHEGAGSAHSALWRPGSFWASPCL